MREHSRRNELRQRNRRVLAWSLGVAVVVHAVVLVFSPPFQAEPLIGAGIELQETTPDQGGGTEVDLAFGPPVIFEHDGTPVQEPPGRTLETSHVVAIPDACPRRPPDNPTTVAGTVRLRLGGDGHVQLAQVDDSTGHPCWDYVLKDVAGDLWYRWLPSDRFPAPVELVQPIALTLD